MRYRGVWHPKPGVHWNLVPHSILMICPLTATSAQFSFLALINTLGSMDPPFSLKLFSFLALFSFLHSLDHVVVSFSKTIHMVLSFRSPFTDTLLLLPSVCPAVARKASDPALILLLTGKPQGIWRNLGCVFIISAPLGAMLSLNFDQFPPSSLPTTALPTFPPPPLLWTHPSLLLCTLVKYGLV